MKLLLNLNHLILSINFKCLYYKFLFIIFPFLICIRYYKAIKSNNLRGIFYCNFIKAIVYVYIFCSILIFNQSEPHFTGLSIAIAILEGGFGVISSQDNYKKQLDGLN